MSQVLKSRAQIWIILADNQPMAMKSLIDMYLQITIIIRSSLFHLEQEHLPIHHSSESLAGRHLTALAQSN